MHFLSMPCVYYDSTGGAPSQPEVSVRLLSSPKVHYSTWSEFSDLLMQVQENYSRCLMASILMDLDTQDAALLAAARNFSFKLTHLQKQGPRIIMELTKQQGPWWCSMVAHFIYARVMRAAIIFQRTMDHLNETALGDESSNVSEHSDSVFSRQISNLAQILKEEVCHTFSGSMPFSIYTLCTGFVSALIVENFTFYNNAEFTAFTNSQFEHILLTLCMGLHARLGARSPLLQLHDEIIQSLCNLICESRLQRYMMCHTFDEML
jgi:hypothetical protein